MTVGSAVLPVSPWVEALVVGPVRVVRMAVRAARARRVGGQGRAAHGRDHDVALGIDVERAHWLAGDRVDGPPWEPGRPYPRRASGRKRPLGRGRGRRPWRQDDRSDTGDGFRHENPREQRAQQTCPRARPPPCRRGPPRPTSSPRRCPPETGGLQRLGIAGESGVHPVDALLVAGERRELDRSPWPPRPSPCSRPGSSVRDLRGRLGGRLSRRMTAEVYRDHRRVAPSLPVQEHRPSRS